MVIIINVNGWNLPVTRKLWLNVLLTRKTCKLNYIERLKIKKWLNVLKNAIQKVGLVILISDRIKFQANRIMVRTTYEQIHKVKCFKKPQISLKTIALK